MRVDLVVVTEYLMHRQ